MKKIFIDLSWIIILSIVVWISGYFIFARFEGSQLKIENISVENNQISRAQGLPVGSYVIFKTLETNAVNARDLKLWRYRLGDTAAELFYEYQTVATSSQPLISRFSNESIRINFITKNGEKINPLVHLNGQIIGPAENGQAIISPNREWLLLSPDDNKSRIFLKNIISNESFDITPTSTVVNDYKPLQWSENGDRVYFMNSVGLVYEFFPATMQLDKIIDNSNINILSASILPFNNMVYGINNSLGGDSIYTKQLGEETKSILSFTDKKISSAILSPHADYIAYSLLDKNNIWLMDISNSQTNKQNLVGDGKVLAWPEKNYFIFSNESGLYTYNISLATSTVFFNSADFKNLDSWDFLDMLYIY